MSFMGAFLGHGDQWNGTTSASVVILTTIPGRAPAVIVSPAVWRIASIDNGSFEKRSTPLWYIKKWPDVRSACEKVSMAAWTQSFDAVVGDFWWQLRMDVER
jgi:hypothetical protein